MANQFLSNKLNKTMKSKAFTLIELLIVVAVIAILAAAVIIAITPGERVAEARDATRTSHLLAIQSALYVYQIDEEEFPVAIPSSLTEICDTGAEQTGHSIDCGDLVDLSFLVPNHLPYIPKDPQGAVASIFLNYVYAAEGNGYKIAKSGDTISLEAPNAETRVVAIGETGEFYTLNMAKNPEEGGIAKDNTGTSPYTPGTAVSITASPAEGYNFINWSASAGSFDNANNTDTNFNMPSQSVTVTANFEELNVVVLNSASGESCNTICSALGRTCASIGLDSEGTNTSFYRSEMLMCIIESGYNCETVMWAGHDPCPDMEGIPTQWTNCRCE